jgi:hypothetical protein
MKGGVVTAIFMPAQKMLVSLGKGKLYASVKGGFTQG